MKKILHRDIFIICIFSIRKIKSLLSCLPSQEPWASRFWYRSSRFFGPYYVLRYALLAPAHTLSWSVSTISFRAMAFYVRSTCAHKSHVCMMLSACKSYACCPHVHRSMCNGRFPHQIHAWIRCSCISCIHTYKHAHRYFEETHIFMFSVSDKLCLLCHMHIHMHLYRHEQSANLSCTANDTTVFLPSTQIYTDMDLHIHMHVYIRIRIDILTHTCTYTHARTHAH